MRKCAAPHGILNGVTRDCAAGLEELREIAQWIARDSAELFNALRGIALGGAEFGGNVIDLRGVVRKCTESRGNARKGAEVF